MYLGRHLIFLSVLLGCGGLETPPEGPFGPRGGLDRETTLDFGVVRVGERAEKRLPLRNRSDDEVRVDRIAADLSPFDGDLRCPGGEPCPSLSVLPRRTFTATFSFSPLRAGEARRAVSVRTSEGELQLVLVGRGVAPAVVCQPPEGSRLDFGWVVAGAMAERRLRCVNEGGIDGAVRASFAGPDAASFSAPPVVVPAGGASDVPVRFVARSPGSTHAATLTLEVEGPATPDPVQLEARVVASALSVEPRPPDGGLDFGAVHPDSKRSITLTLDNLASAPIEVLGLSVPSGHEFFAVEAESPPYTLLGFDPADPTANSRTIHIVFAPHFPGEARGRLEIITTDPAASVRSFELRGRGGGPSLVCSPWDVHFETTASRRSTAIECHSEPRNGDEARLRITEPSVKNRSPGLAVSVDGGVVAAGYAPGEGFRILVTLEPEVDGDFQDVVVFQTDDSQHPEVELPVRGSVVLLPPCVFEVFPGDGLSFGAVEPGREVQLEVAVANRGSTACLLNDVRLLPGSSPAYELRYPSAGMVVPSLRIPAGANARIPVRFAPADEGVAEGALEFLVHGRDAPVRVPLTGSCATACVVQDPAPADLGLVPPPAEEACVSRPLEIRLTNTCQREVELRSVEIPRGQASDEFRVVRSPGAPVALAPLVSATFDVVYEPDGPGEDVAAAFAHTSAAAAPVPIVLRARAEAGGVWTDRFRQSASLACFPLRARPLDGDGDGVLTDRVEITVAIDGLPLEAGGPAGRRWSVDPEGRELCFAPPWIPEEGSGIDVAYRVACRP